MSEYEYSELFKAAQESDILFESGFESDWDNTEELSWTLISVSNSQYDVITYPWNMNEILSVSAGPGSGKTFTLTARIAHILENGVDPSEILVLSMANRSVDALRNSLASIIGKDNADNVDISTFHSFCGLMIDQYAPTLEPSLGKRRIFDKKCWHNLALFFLSKYISLEDTRLEGHITAMNMDRLLSDVTSGMLSVEEAAKRYKINANYIDKLIKYLNRHGMMRYNDLITNALSLIRTSLKINANADPENKTPLLIPRLASYKAVFVDEFQDIYPQLMSIVKAVVTYPTDGYEKSKKHLTISGDPNQSIYKFLGASSNALASVKDALTDMSVAEMSLYESFRCTQPILDAAVNICLKEDDRPEIPLKSNRESELQVKPVLLQHSSQESEFFFIANEIVRLICCLGGLIYPKDIAVLTRTNAEAERIQSIFSERYGIKSHKISQGNIWVTSPMHVYRDILSVISGESDSSFSLLNLLPILDPARGAKLRASKLFNASVKNADPGDFNFLESYLYNELEKVEKKERLAFLNVVYKNCPELLENIARFLNQVQTERDLLNRIHHRCPLDFNPQELAKCLSHMAKLPGIHKYMFKEAEQDSPFSTYLDSFNNSLHHSYDGYVGRPDLHEGMTFVDYFLQTYDNEVPVTNSNLVQVSTIHSAKGLEFPIVFVVGRAKQKAYWDSYLAPDTEESQSSSHLFYVALTRARDLVYVGSGLNHARLLTMAQRTFQCEVPHFGYSTSCKISNQADADMSGSSQKHKNKAVFNQFLDSNATNFILGNGDEGFLRELSKSLQRPVPLSEKLAQGIKSYSNILLSTPTLVTTDLHVSHRLPEHRRISMGPTWTSAFLGAVKLGKTFIRKL